MLGPQIGIQVKEIHDIEHYRSLYEYFWILLNITLDKYQAEKPDFIIIHLKELVLEEHLNKDPLSNITLNKGFLNISEVKRNFNKIVLPFTSNNKGYGYLLQEDLLIDHLTELIEDIKQNSVFTVTASSSTQNFSYTDLLKSKGKKNGVQDTLEKKKSR